MFRAIVTETLKPFKVEFSFSGNNEIEFTTPIHKSLRIEITNALQPYGINLLTNEKLDLVDRIKSVIDEMLQSEEIIRYNTSDYLAEKLNYSYSYLSTLFTEETYSSIESYIILKKVDIAKNILLNSKLTLTEVAYRLNYSSVAHLSRQFKKTTGLTPSAFQRIINQRAQLS